MSKLSTVLMPNDTMRAAVSGHERVGVARMATSTFFSFVMSSTTS